MERATESEYLRWLLCNIDFGPAHSDVMDSLKEQFMEENNKNIPEGYNYNSAGQIIDKE